ncbi:pyridoxal phosphate-dependent transferase [Thermothelomyces heterothallicus CBS 202.75]|uniref:pyridoxal phosphate-dependent transferase n=1 Tax=Thermothelomyces heterothallicus CBS 202.75 TaxID=1149848 RepID=UPI003742EE18
MTDGESFNRNSSGNSNSSSHQRKNSYDSNAKIPSPYPKPVELIRQEQYPHMNQGTYLDHGGATVPALSTLRRTTALLSRNLYGNPHSANRPAARSGAAVDAIRARALAFLGADPARFDLVFTANATAAIKLVADAFRDLGEKVLSPTTPGAAAGAAATAAAGGGGGGGGGGFWYGYHREAHTSLVGVRELAAGGHYCFVGGDDEVEAWLDGRVAVRPGSGPVVLPGYPGMAPGLVAWPGQSNLTGRRLPVTRWVRRVRENGRRKGDRAASAAWRDTYTLVDAAALAMTSGLAELFADPEAAPDFVCLSFYKVFGFPDLGGLVVRKESGHVLALRKYFGGGTVSMVSAIGGAWHLSKALGVAAAAAAAAGEPAAAGDGPHGGALHEGLEDGTLPFHSILALGEAIDVHGELYGSMDNISAYTTALAERMYRGMRALRHADGHSLCVIYEEGSVSGYGNATRQGSTMAFNVLRPDGGYEPYDRVERLANDMEIYVRSGGICCPGGLFTALGYEPWHLHRARSAGHQCGPNGIGIINELPTGVVRASLGAMSTVEDVDRFLSFLRETFISREDSAYASSNGDGSASLNRPED